MVSLLMLIGMMNFGTTAASTEFKGVISSDTTWTQTNSPYNLAGNVLVEKGAALTIEAGALVNLNSYYIRVNGTLTAIGSPTNKIAFNGGQITFTTASNGWNEQANSGCTIENAIIDQTSIYSSNPLKIDNCIITGEISATLSIISNNIITGTISSHSSLISNNRVKGNIVLGSVSLGAVTAPAESSTVSNNAVEGSIISGSPQDTPKIFNNTVSRGGIGCTGYGSIFNNHIYGCDVGISLYTVRVFGGNLACRATVENNSVIGNSKGFSIDLTSVNGGGTHCPTVRNNTISGNAIGISLSELGYDATPIIQYNNLQNNSNYNFYFDAPNNVDVSCNWWGTTDESAISQSIYDFKNDFNLGKVTFVPFLPEPNSDVGSIPELPSSASSSSPTSSSDQTAEPAPSQTTEPATNDTSQTLLLGIVIGTGVTLVLVGVGLLIYSKKRSQQTNPSSPQ